MIPDSRAIQIDAELQRGMTFDATIYVLTRPLAIVAYGALLAAFILNAIVLSLVTAIGSDRAGTLLLTQVLLAAFIVASIAFTRASTRRAITTTMPSGSTVRVAVGDEKIHIVAKQGLSEVPYETFSAFRVGRHAALLRVRGTSVVTAIPRALLDDADIALLKARIG
jgi:hypothetical protein